MFVYLTKDENQAIRAYSTARKAIESLYGQNWQAYVNLVIKDENGNIVASEEIHVASENIKSLISLLNKKGFLTLDNHAGNIGLIEKEKVR